MWRGTASSTELSLRTDELQGANKSQDMAIGHASQGNNVAGVSAMNNSIARVVAEAVMLIEQRLSANAMVKHKRGEYAVASANASNATQHYDISDDDHNAHNHNQYGEYADYRDLSSREQFMRLGRAVPSTRY